MWGPSFQGGGRKMHSTQAEVVVAAGVQLGFGAGDLVGSKGADNHADPLTFGGVDAGAEALTLQVADQLLGAVRFIKGTDLQVDGAGSCLCSWSCRLC